MVLIKLDWMIRIPCISMNANNILLVAADVGFVCLSTNSAPVVLSECTQCFIDHCPSEPELPVLVSS